MVQVTAVAAREAAVAVKVHPATNQPQVHLPPQKASKVKMPSGCLQERQGLIRPFRYYIRLITTYFTTSCIVLFYCSFQFSQIPKKSGEQTPPYRSSSDASKSMTSISPKMSQIGSSNSSSSPSRGANPPSASPKHHHSHHSSSYHHSIPKSGNGSNRSDH